MKMLVFDKWCNGGATRTLELYSEFDYTKFSTYQYTKQINVAGVSYKFVPGGVALCSISGRTILSPLSGPTLESMCFFVKTRRNSYRLHTYDLVWSALDR